MPFVQNPVNTGNMLLIKNKCFRKKDTRFVITHLYLHFHHLLCVLAEHFI